MRAALALLLVAAGVGCAWAAWAIGAAGRRADYWQGRALTAEAKVGASCAPIYGVHWCERSCSGWKAALPSAAQELLCSSRPRMWRGPELEPTRARAEALGPGIGPMLVEERGPKERELPIKWRAEVGK